MTIERIAVRATEREDYGVVKREPIDLSTKVPKRKRFAFKRGSMLLRLWRRRPKTFSPAEQARMNAEYEAEYERWLTEQGFDVEVRRSETEGDALPPVEKDGTYRS